MYSRCHAAVVAIDVLAYVCSMANTTDLRKRDELDLRRHWVDTDVVREAKNPKN